MFLERRKLKKNFEKHLVVKIKSSTFASALQKARIKEAFFE